MICKRTYFYRNYKDASMNGSTERQQTKVSVKPQTHDDNDNDMVKKDLTYDVACVSG